ncbi:Putative Nitroreductase family protein [Aspergillus calidoustus]|uniref:Putative Nitroreductase family protein n=1 Tax=Aspergillus calidoustus TaxID=454130 RepID=A0A0U5CPH6_ASPCI|nr:Putative Nitroreductase family protein [Aspergillus calidoustus]
MGSTAVEFKPETRTLLQLVKTRRTVYGLSNTCSISGEAVEAIIKDAVLHVPSSFNTQTTRVLLLLGEEHQKLWDLTLGIMEGLVAAGSVAKEMFENNTKPKLNGFRGAHGTVLFFVEYDALAEIKKKFPTYANKFDPYALESNAMSQYLVWTALASEGLGANLQHYSPLIDTPVQKQWNIPASWKLDAQLVFGTPTGQPIEKTFAPLEDRFKVFGK